MMNDFRLLIKKEGKQIYVSHLDLMRTMQRVFVRAEVEIKHTEGFNPHPNISFALPLSVGTSSECELMDFKSSADADEIVAALNAAMPEGLGVVECYKPERKFADIKWLRIAGKLYYDNGCGIETVSKLNELFASKSLIVSKRTKRGFADIDLIDCIKEIAFEINGEDVLLSAVISAQNPSIKPELIVEAIKLHAAELMPIDAKFHRVEVYDADMTVFR